MMTETQIQITIMALVIAAIVLVHLLARRKHKRAVAALLKPTFSQSHWNTPHRQGEEFERIVAAIRDEESPEVLHALYEKLGSAK